MVITSTGAGKAISKIMPKLDGKELTANAIFESPSKRIISCYEP